MTNCVGKACSRRTQASERRARPLRHFVLIVCVVKACLPVSAAFSLPSVRSPLFTSTRRANLSDLRLFTTQNTGSSQRAASATTLFTKQNSTSSKLIPDFSQDVGLSTKDKVLVTIMIVAMLFSLGELMNVAGSGAWRYFLAGGICASTSHAITTPIDVVKVNCRSVHVLSIMTADTDLYDCLYCRHESKWTRHYETPRLCKPRPKLFEKKGYIRSQQAWVPPQSDICWKVH